MICCGCNLFCDDVSADSQSTKDCSLGRRWLERVAGQAEAAGVECWIDGRTASLESAVGETVRRLAEAKLPLFCGLTEVSCQAQRAAVRLARTVGAVLDWTTSELPQVSLSATQAVGRVSCTLGEIRQRCDVLVLWGARWKETHPRLLRRVVRDDGSPHIISVGSKDACDTESADIKLGSEQDLFLGLRYLLERLSGVEPTVPLDELNCVPLDDLLARLTVAHYSVFVFDERLIRWGGLETLYRLVRKLNDMTACRVLELSHPFNAVGVQQVLTALAGSPYCVHFRASGVDFRPDCSARKLLCSNSTDLVLSIGPDGFAGDAELQEALSSIPTIVFAEPGDDRLQRAHIGFPIAPAWSLPEQMVFRLDGLPVQLSGVTDSPLPTFQQLAESISAR